MSSYNSSALIFFGTTRAFSSSLQGTEEVSISPLSNFTDALKREMLAAVFINPDFASGFGSPWEIEFQNNYTIRNKGRS
jgi:hypothetical protein